MDVLEKETQPPKPYTDATLLAAMKNAGREIEDDTLAEAMKQTGLGTPATRAEIIEKLIRTGYVQRERKQLRATEKGRALICPGGRAAAQPGADRRVGAAAQGGGGGQTSGRGVLPRHRQFPPGAGAPGSRRSGAVARAGRRGHGRQPGRAKRTGREARQRAGPRAWAAARCARKGRSSRPRRPTDAAATGMAAASPSGSTVAGRKLAKKQVEQLLREGRTERIEGFTSKAGKPFAAALKLGEGFKVEFDFADGPQGQSGVPGSDAAPDRAGG